ncbi:hypothetical protein TWF225_004922 [Orbilia oligospora]|uniref:Uncharacterized protein n=2 Tax=Orbilia oligospora TaxID=2813651 RepID=A0A7C8PXI9_ORBOL|nr:hypothetical protein TWF751_006063 [Orbilia oligospora]KAF3185945.1 hypothetical protein TWF225_004922 [Orbilia oligospora]KAF3263114.1 hypothetical protein TWF128_002068 [Orbilia oligospora]KAF3267480.1 hypothetical protein TWF217_000530 [Orbilia oligospora]KAF3294500.1 hypothetical protein TWF132_003470 [Orbilia oligospora]
MLTALLLDAHHSHSIGLYRNNLVACSKRYNFLFVAKSSKVKVFVPTYPTQAVSKPLLTLHGPEELPELRTQGYIDCNVPHTINNMIVADLGTEEVLLVANDCGYVTLWYTKHLIQRNGNMDIWFDVHKSAWGISVHKAKRLIAISSNTTMISVYEMGSEAVDSSRPPRGAQYPIVLSANHQNVPCVAFLDDDSGRWLAATDITGSVILYDLLREARTMTEYKGQGWTVTFLCESNFLWVEHEEFMEMIERAREEAQKEARRGLLSFATRRFDDDSDGDEADDWASDVQMTLYGGGSEDEEYQDGVSDQLSYSDEDEDEDDDDGDDEDDDEEMSDEDPDIEMNFTALEEAILSHDAQNLLDDESLDEDPEDANANEEHGGLEVTEEMQSTAYGPVNRSISLTPDPTLYGSISQRILDLEDDAPWEYPPPSFIIHSKKFDLKLIIPKDPSIPPPFSYESRPVHLNSLITLKNLIPADGITLAARTSNYPLRMNMHAYIPALSLYVIGRQDGRVALVRMIRSRPPPQSEDPAGTSTTEGNTQNGENKGVVHRHFMNLEHIIPKQDTAIPFALVGVCVAPVQGWEDRHVSNGMNQGSGQGKWLYTNGGVGGRWRIFLLYSGGDVICYTVSGGIPAHENGLVF